VAGLGLVVLERAESDRATKGSGEFRREICTG